MTRTITYNLTRGDLFIGMLTFIPRNRMAQIVLLSYLIISEIVLVVFDIGAGLFSSTILLCVFYAAAFCLIMFVSQAAIALAMAYLPKERGVLGQHTIEINEDGLRERTQFNESLHKWPMVCRIVSQFGYLYIYVGYTTYYQVPKRRISPAEFVGFEAELRQQASTPRAF